MPEAGSGMRNWAQIETRFPYEAGTIALHLANNRMQHLMRAQQSLALYWLDVGAEWAGFLEKVTGKQLQSWGQGAEGDSRPIALPGVGAAGAAVQDYLDLSGRLLGRSTETGRELIRLWTQSPDAPAPKSAVAE